LLWLLAGHSTLDTPIPVPNIEAKQGIARY